MQPEPAKPASWLRKLGEGILIAAIAIGLLAILILLTATRYDWAFLPWHWAREYNPVK